jgi:hypothetical protein
MKTFIVALAAVAVFPGFAAAGNAPSMSDKIVGSTMKILAKAYVTTVNLPRLKAKHIERISKMDEQSFRVSYARTLGVIRESPLLKSKFGLNENMGRAEAMERLQAIDKNTLCRMIDAVPDTVISARFRSFASRRDDAMRGMETPKKIETGWKSFQQRIEQ